MGSRTPGCGQPVIRGRTVNDTGAPTVPPSLLFFLFAHRLGVSGHTVGIVPCHDDAPVGMRALASTLLAAALWGLREAGIARLDVERKWLVVSRHTFVKITLLGEGTMPGLEGQLLSTMRSNPYEGEMRRRMTEKTLERLESSGRSESADRIRERAEERQHRREQRLYVERVIPRWFGEHFRDPDMHVIAAMRDIAVSFGFLDGDRNRSAGPVGMGEGVLVHRANCGRIAEAGEEFEATLLRWHKFQRSEPKLFEALLKHCERGIRNALRSRQN